MMSLHHNNNTNNPFNGVKATAGSSANELGPDWLIGSLVKMLCDIQPIGLNSISLFPKTIPMCASVEAAANCDGQAGGREIKK